MCFLVAITRRSMIKIRGGSRLVGGGSQSGLVICRSTYEPGGGDGATHVSFYLQKG